MLYIILLDQARLSPEKWGLVRYRWSCVHFTLQLKHWQKFSTKARWRLKLLWQYWKNRSLSSENGRDPDSLIGLCKTPKRNHPLYRIAGHQNPDTSWFPDKLIEHLKETLGKILWLSPSWYCNQWGRLSQCGRSWCFLSSCMGTWISEETGNTAKSACSD